MSTLREMDHMAGEYTPVAGSEGENGETIMEFDGTMSYILKIEFPEDYSYGSASTRPVTLILRRGVQGAPQLKRTSVKVSQEKADRLHEELMAGGPFRLPDEMRGGMRSAMRSTRKGKKTRKGRKGHKGRKGTRRH